MYDAEIPRKNQALVYGKAEYMWDVSTLCSLRTVLRISNISRILNYLIVQPKYYWNKGHKNIAFIDI